MEEKFWEGPVAFLCAYWWVILLIIVLGLTAYFTQDYWWPLLFGV